jgi:hypothetical protein
LQRRAAYNAQKVYETLPLSAALPAFSSLSSQQCTIAELATRRRTHSAEKAGVQQCCTSAFGVKSSPAKATPFDGVVERALAAFDQKTREVR